MIFLILIAVLVIIGVIGAITMGMDSVYGWFVAAFVVLIIGGLVSTFAYTGQVSDIEDLTLIPAKQAIYETQAEELVAEFSNLLAEQYPEHERAIFEEIGPENIGIYLAGYPELRAADTVIKLVDEIDQLRGVVYQQQLALEDTKRSIRVRDRNPWFFSWILPNVPAESLS